MNFKKIVSVVLSCALIVAPLPALAYDDEELANLITQVKSLKKQQVISEAQKIELKAKIEKLMANNQELKEKNEELKEKIKKLKRESEISSNNYNANRPSTFAIIAGEIIDFVFWLFIGAPLVLICVSALCIAGVISTENSRSNYYWLF